ncbi:porin family protein [Pseudoalteromonas sp. NEC-BIFX-2020_015]|uniref:outer membrane beta-barrel protein n=1 Tax=Pseudoalteromonas sp. NEC-BIFX-2020_015 TaxID=2729544 RepID=UPI001461674B|nr:outer membrane beta-barrel protein [Pseudoalteromonas sp. NEC-BIFX-2020_015]NMR24846.1 porin family protein [Pseudoalteromonas sp. NEC-BIFX-2020_015]
MKKIIVGGALCVLPLFSHAETKIITEVLIGKSSNDIYSLTESESAKKHYSSKQNTNSTGFRVGLNFTDYLTLELSKHKHGSSDNIATVIIPEQHGFLEHRFEAEIPIDIESIRFGVKGELELFDDFSVNGRFGLAHWNYTGSTPLKLSHPSSHYDIGKSGNAPYASLGFDYKLTKNLYVGLEYSLFKAKDKAEVTDLGVATHSYEHKVKDLLLVVGWKF